MGPELGRKRPQGRLQEDHEQRHQEERNRTMSRSLSSGKLVLFGNSIFAENIYYHLAHDSGWEVAAFTVDKAYIGKESMFGLPVVPFETVESVFPPAAFRMLLPISYQRVNRLREERYRQAKGKGYQLISYVSSRATVFPDLCLGENCIVLDNSVISPFVRIGNNVMITDGVMIGHHAAVNDHSFVGSGAMILGRVTIEEHCIIGANATVKEEVRVARETIVGINVAVTRNTVERGVYVCPPASLLPRRSDHMGGLLSWPAREHQNADDATTDQTPPPDRVLR